MSNRMNDDWDGSYDELCDDPRSSQKVTAPGGGLPDDYLDSVVDAMIPDGF